MDPERDTSEVLKAYAAYFHPRLMALTGTREQISTVATAYGVLYFKLFPPPFQGDDESEPEDANEDDDNSRYVMNHSASTYLVGPDAQTLAIFPHGTPPREMAREIQRFLVDSS